MIKTMIATSLVFLMGVQTPVGEEGGKEETMQETIAVFDYENIEDEESISIYDETGNKAIVTVKKEASPEISFARATNLDNKTYLISYSTLTEKISYKINVKNNDIVSVHSGSYSVFGYTVRSATLRHINKKAASYVLDCTILIRSWTNSLNAKITSSNELTIKLNG